MGGRDLIEKSQSQHPWPCRVVGSSAPRPLTPDERAIFDAAREELEHAEDAFDASGCTLSDDQEAFLNRMTGV